MENPYRVLGIRDGAPQEEVRAAYLQLVKRYHPDRYMDVEMKEKANKRLIAINEAYDAISRHAETGSSVRQEKPVRSSYQGSYSGQDAADFARTRSFLSQNNLQAARNSLFQIGARNAEWYYLCGIVYLREGQPDTAADYLARANRMEPENAEYRRASEAIQAKETNSAYMRARKHTRAKKKKHKGFFSRLFRR